MFMVYYFVILLYPTLPTNKKVIPMNKKKTYENLQKKKKIKHKIKFLKDLHFFKIFFGGC